MASENRQKKKKKRHLISDHNDSNKTGNTFIPSQITNTNTLIILGAAFVIGVFYSTHLGTLFENDRYFSALSPLERELSFRTEMGLYYSYYKTIVESHTLTQGLQLLLHDNLTEYPTTINTLQRFNLYPEVVLGTLFRGLITIADSLKLNLKDCYTINRGKGQSSIETCSGFAVPPYFYVRSVFILNSLLPVSLFLLSSYLSNSILSGLITTMMLFYNHGEATRVMWTPPLRESFSMPFLFLQFLALSRILKRKEEERSATDYILYALCSLLFMIPWQFSQFAMLTQVFSLMAIYSIGLIECRTMKMILAVQLVTLIINTIVQFGNVLLLSSYYAFCLPICLLIVMCHNLFQNIKWKPLRAVCVVGLALVCTVIAKGICGHLLRIRDDAHIGLILLSKFTSYQDFHTQLYTCSPEFDFISPLYFGKLFITLLLPVSVIVIGKILIQTVQFIFIKSHNSEIQQKIEVATLYHVVQTIFFTILATLIMRLKLFLTPQLCLVSGLITNSVKVFKLSTKSRYWLIGGIVVLSSIGGWYNINSQLNIIGEYNNPEMEKLLLWINSSTPQNASFAGSMPLMASIKLSTARPIVNHPHYEDTKIRERTLLVYTIYSQRPVEDIYNNLASLGVQYVVVERGWCDKAYRPGCSFQDIYLKYFPDDRNNSIFCLSVNDDQNIFQSTLFSKEYVSQEYTVLKLTTN